MTNQEQLRLLEDLVPVCEAGDVDSIHEVMCRHFYSLNGARSLFCVADEKYERPFLPESRSFGDVGHLHSFFRSRRIMTMKNRGEGDGFRYTYTISCDTQFPSYLRSRRRGVEIAGRDEAITECLRFLAPYRSGLDIGPYFFENQDRLDAPQVEETGRAFMEFYFAEEGPLATEGRIVPGMSAAELDERVRGMMGALRSEQWAIMAGAAKRNWAVSYVMLLLAAAVHIEHRQRDSDFRLASLLEHMDEVGFFPKVEIHLIHRFFERGNQERFFRGVQENAGRLSDKLRNMAWDLSHKRNIFDHASALAVGVKDHADFVVPYMLSFDAPLTELLRGFQLNGVINYINQGAKFLEVYPLNVEAAASAGFAEVPHLFCAEPSVVRLQRGARFFEDENQRSATIAWAEEVLAQAIREVG